METWRFLYCPQLLPRETSDLGVGRGSRTQWSPFLYAYQKSTGPKMPSAHSLVKSNIRGVLELAPLVMLTILGEAFDSLRRGVNALAHDE